MSENNKKLTINLEISEREIKGLKIGLKKDAGKIIERIIDKAEEKEITLATGVSEENIKSMKELARASAMSSEECEEVAEKLNAAIKKTKLHSSLFESGIITKENRGQSSKDIVFVDRANKTTMFNGIKRLLINQKDIKQLMYNPEVYRYNRITEDIIQITSKDIPFYEK